MEAKIEGTLAQVWGQKSKFFHATVSQRWRTNKIEGLDDEGVWLDSQDDIERVILDYFTNIYSSDHLSSFEASLRAVSQRVTPKMNECVSSERMNSVWP